MFFEKLATFFQGGSGGGDVVDEKIGFVRIDSAVDFEGVFEVVEALMTGFALSLGRGVAMAGQ